METAEKCRRVLTWKKKPIKVCSPQDIMQQCNKNFERTTLSKAISEIMSLEQISNEIDEILDWIDY